MTTAQVITERLKNLPEESQREVLDFVAFLAEKKQAEHRRKEDANWMALSLQSALRGMESEEQAYTSADIKRG